MDNSAYDPFELLNERTKDLDSTKYSYKLNQAGTYGLDIPLGTSLDINESDMSCNVMFAKGGVVDGVGDITEISGISCERHRLNPVVLLDHGKACPWPIALTEDPNTKSYSVILDPISKTGTARCWFYQGRSGESYEDKPLTKAHATFCAEIFDMMAKSYIRSGSFAYQIVRAERLQPNYTNGTPPGLHLLQTRLLELGPTIIPANQDTVLKMLDMPGKSDIFYKSLQPYVVSRPEMVVGGFDSKRHRDEATNFDNYRERVLHRAEHAREPGFEPHDVGERGNPYNSLKDKPKYVKEPPPDKGEAGFIADKAHSSHAYAVDKLEHAINKETDSLRRAHLQGRSERHAHEFTRELLEGKHDKPKETQGEKAYNAADESHRKKGKPIRGISMPKGRRSRAVRIPTEEAGGFEHVPVHLYKGESPQTQKYFKKREKVRRAGFTPKDVKGPRRGKESKTEQRLTKYVQHDQGKQKSLPEDSSYDIKAIRAKYSKGIKPFHSEQDDYQSIEQGNSPMNSLAKHTKKENEILSQFPAEIDRGQKAVNPPKLRRNIIEARGERSNQRIQQRLSRESGIPLRELTAGVHPDRTYKRRMASRMAESFPGEGQKRHPEGSEGARQEEHREGKLHQAESRRHEIESFKYKHEEGPDWKNWRKDPPASGRKSQPSDKIDSDKACQIKKDGSAQGHKLTKKQEGLFGAACGKGEKAYKRGQPLKLSRNLQAAHMNRQEQAHWATRESRTQDIQKRANKIAGSGQDMNRGHGHGSKYGGMHDKGLEDATTNPETKERHELLQEGDAVGMEMVEPSIKEIRSKYQKKKGTARCLKKSVPGSFMIHVEGKQLEAMKSAAGKAGIKCECGEAHEGAHKVRLTGLDDAVHKLAGKYGKPGTIGKKGVEIESDEKAINPPKLDHTKDTAHQYGGEHNDTYRTPTESRLRKIVGNDKIVRHQERNRSQFQKQSRNIHAQDRLTHQMLKDQKLRQGKKGLEFNVKIQCPNPEYVIQKAQLFGIGAWEDDGGVVLSGIDEVEIGRFLRQFKIMDDAQIAILFGGRLAGHKSYEQRRGGSHVPQGARETRLTEYVNNDNFRRKQEDVHGTHDAILASREERTGTKRHLKDQIHKLKGKSMEIHVKDSSSDKEEKEPKEQPLAQDETPADQAEYTETPGETYPEDSYEDGYEEGGEDGFEDEGPQEKLGAQVLRELHGEMEEFLMKYDEILPLVEHEGVTARLQGKLESVAAELEEIESEFEANYPEYGGLGNKEMEGGMAPEHEEEGASSEGLPEPDPDEVVEGMSKHPDDEENEEEFEGRGEKAMSPGRDQAMMRKHKAEGRLDKHTSRTRVRAGLGGPPDKIHPVKAGFKKGFSLLDYEIKSVYDATTFLKALNQTTALNEDLKFDSYFHGKSLLAIQTRIDDFAAKGSLLPKPSGDATEGEDDEVNVNHPNGPSHYTPGKEPMQQYGKGSILDHYEGGGDAGDALGEDKDVDSHINHPDSNSQVKPGEDDDHMAYDHDGEWPHKGSLLPAPSGDAGEGEPEEVHVNHPSSNPQAKPGADEKHQWFGKPAEWPHKELAPQGQYYKAIAEAGQYLKALSQCKAYGDALKEQAVALAKALDPIAAQTEAVGVSKPSGWDPKLGQEPAQPFGKEAAWPSKSITSKTNGYFKSLNATQAKLDALVKLVRKA